MAHPEWSCKTITDAFAGFLTKSTGKMPNSMSGIMVIDQEDTSQPKLSLQLNPE
jgi:hypothetical protein